MIDEVKIIVDDLNDWKNHNYKERSEAFHLIRAAASIIEIQSAESDCLSDIIEVQTRRLRSAYDENSRLVKKMEQLDGWLNSMTQILAEITALLAVSEDELQHAISQRDNLARYIDSQAIEDDVCSKQPNCEIDETQSCINCIIEFLGRGKDGTKHF